MNTYALDDIQKIEDYRPHSNQKNKKAFYLSMYLKVTTRKRG
jgi:hypothetical protein